jgi:hypothetical protein
VRPNEFRISCSCMRRLGRGPAAMSAPTEHGIAVEPVVLCFHMPKTPKPDTRPLFTPSTLPQPDAPDPVVTFIEEALLAIANRQDEEKIPEPSA